MNHRVGCVHLSVSVLKIRHQLWSERVLAKTIFAGGPFHTIPYNQQNEPNDCKGDHHPSTQVSDVVTPRASNEGSKETDRGR